MTRTQRIAAKIKQGLPACEIARQEGVSPAYVYKLAKDNELTIRPRPRGPRPIEESALLSPVHAAVGRRIYHYRCVEHDLTDIEFANVSRISKTKVQNAEHGTCELTLTDLLRIAELLGVDVAELIGAEPIRFEAIPGTR